MALAQRAERTIDVADRARHDGLADARWSRKHHVPAGCENRQALLPPPALDLQAGEQLVDLGFHRVESNHGLEIIQRVIRGSGDQADLPGRPIGRKPSSVGVALPDRHQPHRRRFGAKTRNDVAEPGRCGQGQRYPHESQRRHLAEQAADPVEKANLRVEQQRADARRCHANDDEGQDEPRRQKALHERLICMARAGANAP